MKPSLDLETLDRYLSGTHTPEDAAHVSAWAAGSLERKRLLNSLVGRKLPLSQEGREWDGQKMWASFGEVSNRALTDKHTPLISDKKIGYTFRYRPLFAGLSAALVLLSIGFLASGSIMPFAGKTSQWSASSGREIVTGSGQRTTIELADGSRILLAPESKLVIPENFGARTRTISVDGEVYVTAAQDAERPFIIKSGDVETRVLGTRFTVRKYQEDSVVRVAVMDGRVTVGDVVVGAGDVARVIPHGMITVQAEMNVDRYLGWSKGILTFEDQPLSDVVSELSRTYGVNIILDDSTLKDEKITATFDNQPVGTILKYLSLALNTDLEQSGNKAVLSLRSNGKSVSLPTPTEDNE